MNFRRILSQIALVAGALLFSVGVQTFAAFTAPTTAPPGADAYAPLHTGSGAQSKAGGLLLNTGGFGNVGIGTLTPAVKLDVAGAIKFGNAVPNADCTASTLGSARYNATAKEVEFCSPDGGGAGVPGWKSIGGASFGPWEPKVSGTIYQAATDGVVVSTGGYGNDCGYTDANNPPTTAVACDYAAVGWGGSIQLTFPVKKGDYWKVGSMTSVKWLPLVSGGGSSIGAPGTLTAGTSVVMSPVSVPGIATQAHGLGGIPTLVNSYLECLSAEQGYNVGDRIPESRFNTSSSAGWHVRYDATNVYILSSVSGLVAVNGTSPGAGVVLTPSKWKIVVVPYKLN
ncbi:MAG: hypothetical protein NT108_00305 [Candidatus Kaiserbacteria bacterium]|nr:hypothetical protein [Candidatus Kaiserbacteria bacterium]